MSRSASWPIRRTPLGESCSARPSAPCSRTCFEQQHHLAQVLEILHRLLAQHLAAVFQSRSRRSCPTSGPARAASCAPSRASARAPAVVEALGAVEQMLVAAIAEVLEVADVLVFLEQLLEVGAAPRRPRTRSSRACAAPPRAARHLLQLALLLLDRRACSPCSASSVSRSRSRMSWSLLLDLGERVLAD